MTQVKWIHYKDNPVLNFNNTEWKPVNSYEEYYLVSVTGCVWSIRRNIQLKPQNGVHYLQVQLNKNGKGVTRTIHRLVAESFIHNPDRKPEVNHKDGNKLNNNTYNLEWVTSSENQQHACDTGLQPISKPFEGKKVGSSSKYHNVLCDRKRWRARVKLDGKIVLNKNFTLETDAALAVNQCIILHNLPRPLNIIK